ncbi:MAG: hypothetical protein PHF37_07030 [Phycisphaerae bacterium]|nr:hypothetical protein [Phycisphaerae bacterium]
MNTFWPRVILVTAALTGLFVAGILFTSKKDKSYPTGRSLKFTETTKSYQDVIDEDEKRFTEPIETQPQPRRRRGQAADQNEPMMAVPQFREMLPEEKSQAEELYEMAKQSYKMGRLPGMTFKKAVDYCRDIIEKFPGTEYEYRARKMLGDIPERYKEMYNITPEEINPRN